MFLPRPALVYGGFNQGIMGAVARGVSADGEAVLDDFERAYAGKTARK